MAGEPPKAPTFAGSTAKEWAKTAKSAWAAFEAERELTTELRARITQLEGAAVYNQEEVTRFQRVLVRTQDELAAARRGHVVFVAKLRAALSAHEAQDEQ